MPPKEILFYFVHSGKIFKVEGKKSGDQSWTLDK